jgi:dihydropyrimidine dehydrogenase (NAD+) subunit PreA
MVSALANDLQVPVPLCGIGGIETWQDAVEYLLLGASTVQVCTAAMHYGFRIIHELTTGLNDYLDRKHLASVGELTGKSANRVGDWNDLRLSTSYKAIAHIHEDQCIGCNLCYIACDDGGHQCIDRLPGRMAPVVREVDCVGCNLCALVCPVPDCIEMVGVDLGISETWNQRQKRTASDA